MYSLLFTILVMVFTTIHSPQAKVWDNDTITKVYKESQEKSASVFLTRLMDMPVQEHEKGKEESIRQNNRAETVLSIFGTMGPFRPEGKLSGYVKRWSVSAIKTALDTLGKDKVDGEYKNEFSRLFHLENVSAELAKDIAYQTHVGALWTLYQTCIDKDQKIAALGEIKLGDKVIEIKEDEKRITARQEEFKKILNQSEGINNLPPELKIHVASFLDKKDRKNLRSTSKYWDNLMVNNSEKIFKIVLEPHLSSQLPNLSNKSKVEWVTINARPLEQYSPSHIYLDQAIQAIAHKIGSQIRGIAIRGNVSFNPESLLKFNNLEFLNIGNPNILPKNFFELLLNKLKIIKFGDGELTNVSWMDHVMESNPNLLNTIEFLFFITEYEHYDLLFQNAHNFKSLKKLYIHTLKNDLKTKEFLDKFSDSPLSKEIDTIILNTANSKSNLDQYIKNINWPKLKNIGIISSKKKVKPTHESVTIDLIEEERSYEYLFTKIIPDLPKEFMR